MYKKNIGYISEIININFSASFTLQITGANTLFSEEAVKKI